MNCDISILSHRCSLRAGDMTVMVVGGSQGRPLLGSDTWSQVEAQGLMPCQGESGYLGCRI